jgi:two-component system KDP operon response regulator KdpE
MVRMKKPRILIVDDEVEILRLVESVVAGAYNADSTSSAAEALALVERDAPDLIILDLLMPGMDGFEVCRRLRRWSQVPILVLSGRDRPGDKAKALDLGADDYLTKPFSVEELLARIRAILRRVVRPEQTFPPTLVVGDLRIDFDRQQVLVAGHEVKFTPTEFRLLRELAVHPGKLMTHSMLLRRVWGPEYRDEVDYLRVFIRRLRRKIEPDPDVPRYIITESRAGYRFQAPQLCQHSGD